MKVSVVVPIYQSADTLKACIDSILAQSLDDLQLVLVDDGSTDASGAICDEAAKADPRVVVIHQSNKGRTEARAVGVKRAEGEWLCFVDSDDTLPVNSLKDLYEKASLDTDIVFGNGHTLAGENRASIPMDDFRHLAVRGVGTIGVPWGSMYRRSVLCDYLFDLPREILNGEDYIFWLRLVFLTGKPVNVVYKTVYNKGEEHTSNVFVWTAEYAARLNHFRWTSIPEDVREDYLADTVSDRMANLFSVAVCTSRSDWAKSPFYLQLCNDMNRAGIRKTLRQRFFLAMPSRYLRKMMSKIRG